MNAYEFYVLEQFLHIRQRFPIHCQESVFDHLKSIYCAWNWSLLTYEEHLYYYDLQAMSEEATGDKTFCVLMPSIDEQTKKIKLTPIRHSSDPEGNVVPLPTPQVISMVLCERNARHKKVEDIKEQLKLKKMANIITASGSETTKQEPVQNSDLSELAVQYDEKFPILNNEAICELNISNQVEPFINVEEDLEKAKSNPSLSVCSTQNFETNTFEQECESAQDNNSIVNYESPAQQLLTLDIRMENIFLESSGAQVNEDQYYITDNPCGGVTTDMIMDTDASYQSESLLANDFSNLPDQQHIYCENLDKIL